MKSRAERQRSVRPKQAMNSVAVAAGGWFMQRRTISALTAGALTLTKCQGWTLEALGESNARSRQPSISRSGSSRTPWSKSRTARRRCTTSWNVCHRSRGPDSGGAESADSGLFCRSKACIVGSVPRPFRLGQEWCKAPRPTGCDSRPRKLGQGRENLLLLEPPQGPVLPLRGTASPRQPDGPSCSTLRSRTLTRSA